MTKQSYHVLVTEVGTSTSGASQLADDVLIVQRAHAGTRGSRQPPGAASAPLLLSHSRALLQTLLQMPEASKCEIALRNLFEDNGTKTSITSDGFAKSRNPR